MRRLRGVSEPRRRREPRRPISRSERRPRKWRISFGCPLWYTMHNQMLQIASDTPLFEVVGARVPALRRLEKMGIKTVRDLLWHFPTRYEDFSKIYPIAELEPGQQATIQGIVEEVQSKRSWRRAMSIVEATIADETGTIRAVWFNQPYVANVLKTGRAANFAGKASVSEEGEIYFSNPVYEVIHTRAGAGSRAAVDRLRSCFACARAAGRRGSCVRADLKIPAPVPNQSVDTVATESGDRPTERRRDRSRHESAV